MAIEITGKGGKKGDTRIPENLDLFLPVTIILFVVMGILYFTLIYLSAKAEETKTSLEESIKEQEKNIPRETEENARKYNNLIDDFKTIINDHHSVMSFFPSFENMMHPRIMIKDLSVNLQGKNATFSGSGDGFISVGQQFHVLKTRPFISEADLTNFSRKEDGVNFTFSIKFTSDATKFVPRELTAEEKKEIELYEERVKEEREQQEREQEAIEEEISEEETELENDNQIEEETETNFEDPF